MGDHPGDRLASADAAILGVESEAILGHTLKLLTLEPGTRPLTVEELRDIVAARIDRVPAACRRIDESEADPCWVDVEHPDVSALVNAHPIEGDGDEAVRRAAEELMSTRLDHTRPLWALDLLGPLGDGRQTIVARIHHALADGISCLRLLGELLWDAEAASDEAAPHRHGPPREADHRGPAGELLHLPGALWRELGRRARHSPFDQRVGAARAVAFASMPLEQLHEAGRSRPGHATVNDALLGVVAGGLGRWLERGGSAIGRIRAQIPVSLHQRADDPAELGNRDSFLNVSLPLDEPDPLRRLDLISAETSKLKRLGDARELYEFFHAVGCAPALSHAARRLARSPSEFALAISNVPGPHDQVRVAGRRVERLASVAEPAQRHSLRIAAISCEGTLTVALCTDPEALPDVDELATAIDEGFAELRDAAIG